jgi:hypothetical protein
MKVMKRLILLGLCGLIPGLMIGQLQFKTKTRNTVVQTGMQISRVDRAVSPVLKDTGQIRIFMLPELYYAKVEGTNQPISYRILFIDSAPLRFNPEKEQFEGSIRFLPAEIKENGNAEPVQKQLAAPEEIILSYGSSSIPINIRQINWPPLDVAVTSAEPRDSVEVRIITVSNPLGYPMNLAVEPAIILSSTRTTIQGFGLQTVPVHLALKGVSSYRPVPVTVEASRGSLDSASFTLTDDRPRETVLRSESTGTIELKVINPNYRSNTISITGVFPWLFLVLAITGGLIGGLGKTLNAKERVTIRPLALGSIFGLIAAVAYWGLGIVLIGVSFQTQGYNEAMVLGFGLIAGFFGLKAVTK